MGMTATDELRRRLDERGVEWEAFDDFEHTTQWSTHNGAFVYWARERDGKLLVETTAPTKGSASCTPEQAIAATMGRKEYVYALTAIDPEDGREYMLGIYATRELVEKSIETNGRGYTLHYVSRWEVADE